jgi:glycerol-3-phosphate dehydrogenase (NAD(P)+)
VSRIAVIGAGAWGTALSIALARGGRHQVHLWAHESSVRDSILRHRANELFLPGHTIPGTVVATNDLGEALRQAEIAVSVMPSHHCRRVFSQMAPHLSPGTLFVSATKGLENQTLLRMTDVITDVLRRDAGFEPRIGALSGPSFAQEVARGDPTAVTTVSDTHLSLPTTERV